MNRKRRSFSAGFKARVAPAATKGDKALAELASQFAVYPNQISGRKKQLFDGAIGLIDAGHKQASVDESAEASRLYDQIGRLKSNSIPGTLDSSGAYNYAAPTLKGWLANNFHTSIAIFFSNNRVSFENRAAKEKPPRRGERHEHSEKLTKGSCLLTLLRQKLNVNNAVFNGKPAILLSFRGKYAREDQSTWQFTAGADRERSRQVRRVLGARCVVAVN